MKAVITGRDIPQLTELQARRAVLILVPVDEKLMNRPCGIARWNLTRKVGFVVEDKQDRQTLLLSNGARASEIGTTRR